ncbi:MAG: GntR family transcriptional regulator [Gammaproteobacteria bacterium]|nr:MAG: GntR family transcriptional regulator [Gammaproteobacteria bacterium]
MANVIGIANKPPSKTLADQVYRQIRDDIVHGDLPPGSKLKIEPLRTRYQIGASPLREALSRLYSDGFVSSKGQQGFKVMEMTRDDLEDVTNLRILIENKALSQSIINGDDHWESGVVAAFHRLTKIETTPGEKDIHELEDRNNSFHNALLAASSSIRLHQFYTTLYDQHKRYRNLARGVMPYKRNIHEEHTTIYNATLEKDIKKATEANEYHIRKTAELVIQLKNDEWDN